jgi:hypothetical protein
MMRNFIEPNYPSDNIQCRLTCCHSNTVVNSLNLAANWYLGRKVQYDKQLNWDEFIKYISIFLEGERIAVTRTLKPVLGNLFG